MPLTPEQRKYGMYAGAGLLVLLVILLVVWYMNSSDSEESDSEESTFVDPETGEEYELDEEDLSDNAADANASAIAEAEAAGSETVDLMTDAGTVETVVVGDVLKSSSLAVDSSGAPVAGSDLTVSVPVTSGTSTSTVPVTVTATNTGAAVVATESAPMAPLVVNKPPTTAVNNQVPASVRMANRKRKRAAKKAARLARLSGKKGGKGKGKGKKGGKKAGKGKAKKL